MLVLISLLNFLLLRAKIGKFNHPVFGGYEL